MSLVVVARMPPRLSHKAAFLGWNHRNGLMRCVRFPNASAQARTPSSSTLQHRFRVFKSHRL